jgi:serine/threonine protein kinase
VELAAEGSFARIYRARPAHLPPDGPADYAVKLPRPRWQSDRWAIGQLAREAVVGRSVSHPNLISILAASLGVEPRFLVMPWLEGRTLQSQLDATSTPDLPVALWIARQVAEALRALHGAGWMHGDVKPSNILVSPSGHVTLLDLGFARRGHETGSAVDRRMIGGTCSHIAPEFVTSAVREDIRSDIYSLGVVLFELFSGRLPFEGKNMAELLTHHKRSSPPDLRRLAPHLPAEVVQLVHQMLAKEPLRRPQTPRELVQRLTALEVATFSERLF